MHRHFVVIAAAILLTACSGVKSAKVQSLQPTDKQLACADIKIEVNEAEFFKRKAEENRGLSFRNVLMPHTYPSTYMSSSSATSAAQERIDYLKNIYEIRGCEKVEARIASAPAKPTPAPVQYSGNGYMGYAPVPASPYGYPPQFYPQNYMGSGHAAPAVRYQEF